MTQDLQVSLHWTNFLPVFMALPSVYAVIEGLHLFSLPHSLSSVLYAFLILLFHYSLLLTSCFTLKCLQIPDTSDTSLPQYALK